MDIGMMSEASELILLAGFLGKLNPFKAAKKVVKKVVKTVLKAPGKILSTGKRAVKHGIDISERGARYGKDKIKGVIRSPGRMMNPKVDDPKVMFGPPDEDELGRKRRRRRRARRGSRGETKLTTGLG